MTPHTRRRKPNYAPLIVFGLFVVFLLLSIVLTVVCIKQGSTVAKLDQQVQTLTTTVSEQKAQNEKQASEWQQKYDKLSEEYEALKKAKATTQSGSGSSGEYTGPTAVYLTFDDGPSHNTEKILDILKQYNIKATFFCIGNESDYAKSLYKRMVDEGHTIANHTYYHTYKTVYKSTDAFWDSVTKFEDFIESVTGTRPKKILRFPGGSNNTVSNNHSKNIMKTLTKQAVEKGYLYYDWNVSSMDAEKPVQDKSVIINSVLNQSFHRKRAIVLFHDAAGKTTTVEALPTILDTLIQRGCTFAAIDETVEPMQFLKAS